MNLTPRTPNYEKYQTQNRLMRSLIERFVRHIVSSTVSLNPSRVADLGCGEGIIARRILDRLSGVSYLGIELGSEAATEARKLVPEAEIIQGNILEEPPRRNWADVTICLEVLEHLLEPHRALEKIAVWTRGVAIISVPWEPWFRLGNFFRGKYSARLGNHPEHVHQFTPRSFESLLIRHFESVEVDRVFPWIVARCRGSHGG